MIPPVVDQAWLIGRPDAVLADVRWYLDGRDARAAYDAGHLPGAVFVELERWLSAPASPAQGRHPMPHPATFAEGMSSLGIGDDDVVIAYDDSGGITASRLVWMLRRTGHDAALLDGGLAAWTGALTTEPGSRPPAAFAARPWPADLLVDIDEASAPGPGVTVIDARQRERFLGAPDGIDPRAGHIPGAQALPCRENLGETSRLLPIPLLRQQFADVGIAEGADVISYCGSGVSACLNLIAMEHAGLGIGRLYAGSWSQYSQDTSRPVATTEGPSAP